MKNQPQNAPDLGADGPAALRRLTYDATHRGRVVARAVASDPLDHYSRAAQITDRMHEAGARLRAALAGSWPAQRVTAPARYVSGEGIEEEHDEAASDEERWAERTRHWKTIQEAEKLVGPQHWSTVRGVCEGRWATSYGGIRALQIGLDLLADGWRMPRT